MRHVPTLLARELGAYFLGPMAYLVLLAFQVIALLNFWELVDALEPAPARVLEPPRPDEHLHLGAARRSGSASSFAVPLLTMRLIAEERRTGTIETLLTLPVTEAEIVVRSGWPAW